MSRASSAPLVGLKNYKLRPLSTKAQAAVARLRANGWCQDVETTCACGQRFRTWTAIHCFDCVPNCPHVKLPAYDINADGRAAPRQYCGLCGTLLADPTRHSWIFDYRVRDHRTTVDLPPCERCQSTTGVQLHHWAPRAIFLDASAWPTAYLCPLCHGAWHEAMKLANGLSLPTAGRASSPNANADNTDPWLWAKISGGAA